MLTREGCKFPAKKRADFLERVKREHCCAALDRDLSTDASAATDERQEYPQWVRWTERELTWQQLTEEDNWHQISR